jgi:hypothetical protein
LSTITEPTIARSKIEGTDLMIVIITNNETGTTEAMLIECNISVIDRAYSNGSTDGDRRVFERVGRWILDYPIQ